MGGITLGILPLHQLLSLGVLTLTRGRLPPISPYQFPAVQPELDEPYSSP